MKEALLLVFANKQDIAGGKYPINEFDNSVITQLCTAMSPQEVQERLKLSQLKDKIWYVVPSCATTGEGLFEGLVRFIFCLLASRRGPDIPPGLAFE